MNYIPHSACPDCGGALDEIELTDFSTGQRVRRYGYSLLSPASQRLDSQFGSSGEVKFFMCLNCGRVMLVAQPG